MARRKRKPKPDLKLRAQQLDDDGVIELLGAMFEMIRYDYKRSLRYLERHPNADIDSNGYIYAMKNIKECERFTKTEFYYSIIDCEGGKMLNRLCG